MILTWPVNENALRTEGVFAWMEGNTQEILPAQETLQPVQFLAGLVHIVTRRFDIMLVQCAVGFAQVVVHPVLCAGDVAANVVALRLLLAAELFDTAGHRLGARIEIHEAVAGAAHLLRRWPHWRSLDWRRRGCNGRFLHRSGNVQRRTGRRMRGRGRNGGR